MVSHLWAAVFLYYLPGYHAVTPPGTAGEGVFQDSSCLIVASKRQFTFTSELTLLQHAHVESHKA